MLNDAQSALRSLHAAPAFVFLAVVTISLGVGLTLASSQSSTQSCCGRFPTRIQTVL